MWTASIQSVELREGMVWAEIQYSSDDPTVSAVTQKTMGDTLDKAALAEQIQNKLDSLNRCDASFATFADVPLKTAVDVAALGVK
jgi:hypothetical protein